MKFKTYSDQDSHQKDPHISIIFFTAVMAFNWCDWCRTELPVFICARHWINHQ